MAFFILRRLVQGAFTIFGVMLLTFLLFKVFAGDVSARYVNPKLGQKARVEWLIKHGFDNPDGTKKALIFNTRRHLPTSRPAGADTPLAAPAVQPDAEDSEEPASDNAAAATPPTSAATQPTTPAALPEAQLAIAPPSTQPASRAASTDAAQAGPDQRLMPWDAEFYDSLFFRHLKESLTFSGRSFETEEPLTEIIRRQAPYSLAITVPALAIGWLLELVIACLVAYYRDSLIDKLGVFFSVLGMCVPFLAYMILAQAVMFHIAPTAAWGLQHPANIYLPVLIDVIAGLGGGVRFYRTVILDETNRDYVRTAKAKGVPLPSILFKHVLKNCMLPILTSLVLSIPFLIMGNLLLERFFGIPGLGDLLISSINNRDVPIIAGLTFLTALVYTLGLLLTDILYAVFDPRIRLR